MKNLDKNIQGLIAEYLNSEISEDNLRTLEEYAGKTGIRLDDLAKTYQQLDQLDVPEPGNEMDDKFYAMLSQEKESISKKASSWGNFWEQVVNVITFPQVPRLAYGFILLLIGLLVGNMVMPNRGYEKQISAMSTEVSEMRNLMVLSMIENDKATNRIKAVNYVDDMEKPDSKVINALFKTLNNDKNINVRLVSLETLVKFAHLPAVREGLVKSIEQQESPIVLLELAEVLMQLQDEKSLKELQNLLKKEDLEPGIRAIVESGINKEV